MGAWTNNSADNASTAWPSAALARLKVVVVSVEGGPHDELRGAQVPDPLAPPGRQGHRPLADPRVGVGEGAQSHLRGGEPEADGAGPQPRRGEGAADLVRLESLEVLPSWGGC